MQNVDIGTLCAYKLKILYSILSECSDLNIESCEECVSEHINWYRLDYQKIVRKTGD